MPESGGWHPDGSSYGRSISYSQSGSFRPKASIDIMLLIFIDQKSIIKTYYAPSIRIFTNSQITVMGNGQLHQGRL